jgi:transposase-like protein
MRIRKWQRYTDEFRADALRRLKGCENIGALARELKVSRGILYQWRDKQEGRARKKRPGPVVDTPAIAGLKNEVDQLKIALANKTLEADFFKGALQSIEDRRRKSGSSGDSASTDTSKR